MLLRTAAERGRDPVARTSTEVASHGDVALVRYRLGSPEHSRDLAEAGGRAHGGLGAEYPMQTAVFGVVDRTRDTTLAVFEVFDEGKGRGLNLSNYFSRGDGKVDPDAMLAFLRLVDVPASYHQGEDMRIAGALDLWYDPAGAAWERRAPIHAVCVGFERTCFGVHPVISEATDVLLPDDPARDMASADEDAAYWAREHYRARAWEALGDLGTPVRPGFSSWCSAGEPRRVKVVEARLYDEFAARLAHLPEEDGAPTPAGPR